MKKLLALIPLASLHLAVAQVRDYDPSVQPVDRIQYFKPAESHLFVGDCMPFDYRGTFYLYWLIDEGHHAGLGRTSVGAEFIGRYGALETLSRGLGD